MITATNFQLGDGIYSVTDISTILRLPANKIRRWLTEFYDSRLSSANSTQYSVGEGRDKAANFLTLIEFYVFSKLREKLSVHKVLSAHKHMAKELKTKYPFASYQLLANDKHILYGKEEGTWVQADKSNQIVIHKILAGFFEKIDFSSEDIAQRFWPLGKDRSIVVDPHHQFGQPVVEGTNINAYTIYSMYESGDSLKSIGILYDLKPSQLDDAISFYKQKVA